jgi:membrane protein DedA with SNARE-associated domain
VLALAGYLVHAGHLRLWLVITVGVVSAAIGDNAGYWIGRRLGRPAIERYGRRIGITPARMESVARFVERYGGTGVFAARFLPGIRVLAGPLAGASGLPAGRFLLANLLGAACFVPYAVGIGYAVGYGLGGWLRQAEHVMGRFEHLAALVILAGVVLALALRSRRARAA